MNDFDKAIYIFTYLLKRATLEKGWKYKIYTYGSDQTTLVLASESVILASTPEEQSIEGASIQGVTSICRYQIRNNHAYKMAISGKCIPIAKVG